MGSNINRKQWYLHYRDLRLSKKQKPLSFHLLNEALKEIYGIYLTGKDRVKFDLIKTYEHKVSLRLKEEFKALKKKGEIQSKQLFKDLVFSKNPFLELIPKGEFKGSYYPIPTIKAPL